MSQSRIKQRVRRNEDFRLISKAAKAIGLSVSVVMPTGKGAHPRVTLSDGARTLTMTIACTPRYIHRAKLRHELISRLLAAGFDFDSEKIPR